ncbi:MULTISPECIES: PEP/pyruvate-binding domain-containing protein [unclassified Variovorax]|uniref:PEP/pyruvate-binding domain-containing protein n=1 Tax=unclassified Variovorax TaxID=663243 RepID=UPI000AEE8363|nr:MULTISPECIES: PEP/pyruvate-binding domain-containing protein [unclassified Variovorax]
MSATLPLVGGKGASLARMARAGFPVPPGLLITTEAYRAFIDANALQASIVALAKDAKRSSEDASKEIRELFGPASIPPDVLHAIQRAYAELTQASGDTLPLAVRSTATAEDLPGASFAGQHDSFLNVRGEQALLDAVKRCWSSLWTARALEYRARKGVEPSAVWMAVVVQRMVAAEAAGVLFTANPMTGARDEIVLDASWGLGEAIVGGSVTPDHIVVNKTTDAIKEIKIGDKAVMTTLSDTGTVESEVDENKRRAQVLSAPQVTELVTLGRAIENLYGAATRARAVAEPRARRKMDEGCADGGMGKRAALAAWRDDDLRHDGQRTRTGAHVSAHSQTSQTVVRSHQRMAVSARRSQCAVADRIDGRDIFVFPVQTAERTRARQAPLDEPPPRAGRARAYRGQ